MGGMAQGGGGVWMLPLGHIQPPALGCKAPIQAAAVCSDLYLINIRHRSKQAGSYKCSLASQRL